MVLANSNIIISIAKIHITILKMISEQKVEKKHILCVINNNIITTD